MKRARDYRESAWNILRGRYWWTVLAGLIAAILGGYSGRNSFSFNFKHDYNSFAQQVQNLTDGRIDVERIRAIMHPFAGVLASVAGLVLVYAIAMFIVGSAIELGHNRFNLSLYESTAAPKIETLFSRFSHFGNAVSLRLLMFVKTLLWALLFVNGQGSLVGQGVVNKEPEGIFERAHVCYAAKNQLNARIRRSKDPMINGGEYVCVRWQE